MNEKTKSVEENQIEQIVKNKGDRIDGAVKEAIGTVLDVWEVDSHPIGTRTIFWPTADLDRILKSGTCSEEKAQNSVRILVKPI